MCKGACAGTAAAKKREANANIVVEKDPSVCAKCEFGGEARKAAGVSGHADHDHSGHHESHEALVAARSSRALTDTSGLSHFT